jgi:predicted MPP superfamily phosphohydrolase
MHNSSDGLPYLRWLHLTDLHIGNNVEAQRVAMKSLVKAIAAAAGDKKFDVVFLTGDLVYSGQKAEFDTLDGTLIGPLRALEMFKEAIFCAVPGNHDLDCEVGCPIQWAGIGASRQENFFNSDAKGQQVRSGRSSAFTEYSAFIKSANIVSVDPTSQPATLCKIEVRGNRFAIVPIVTSFFSDKEVKDYQKAPIPVQPVRSILQDESQDYALALLLGHHPANWFLQETERRFNTLVVETNALYLHGHEHLITPKFSGRGLTSLGFGASYQASLDSTAKTYYRNSFAVCELDEQLHVQVISWDGENGIWRPDQHLPVDFADPSERLNGGYKFKLPTTAISATSTSPLSILASAVKSEAKIERCLWLANDDVKRWGEILVTMGYITFKPESYKLPAQVLPAGHVQFRIKDSRGQYLVHGISANGDVLNYEQLKNINTELDTQDYDGCFVLTMGTLAKESRTLADQLSARKPLHVFERTEVVRASIRTFTPDQKQMLSRVDPERTLTSLIVTTKGLALLFEDRTKFEWFSVLDELGNQPPEAAEIIWELRGSSPSLARMKYEKALAYATLNNEDITSTVIEFDRAEYLRRSHAYFDDVRYAPLAALGLKFKKASLSEMYVSASADVGGTTKTSQNATRALTELMESLGLPKAQRDQLEAQLRARYGLDRTAEVGAASQLYQRYNNIVVLGDPGSGKTCFLKHEILSYCSESEQDGGWYSAHLPVYVSLAEAAKLYGEGIDLLDICAGQSSRRGIDLPRNALEDALAIGHVAFFFDGLDEVGLIEKRIGLMAEIGSLVKSYAQRGNRFVLASRPAAVQPVDVPESFTYVQLKGLTEDEMRILAGRVMTARLGEMPEEPLAKDENDLVERLLTDTRNSPGIARIAKNPLLLTLLVLIYANTGALTAKRHIIYTQAIKTLVSVRGRDIRDQQISESDLRTRLGAVAVSIFSRQIDEIPKRSDVIRILGTVMTGSTDDAEGEISQFVQEVAEATGLLSIHNQGDAPSSEDLITFMHFSFLEYYTAAGLISRGYTPVLTRLSRNPRWKDVTTLMFGILSDYRDITPDLKTLLHDETAAGQITQYKLLLAMDCASECDVPPEGAQDLLANAIFQSVSAGAGRYSRELREELAKKLQYFLIGGGPRLENAVIRGLRAENPFTVASFCDLIASLDGASPLSARIQSAFEIAIQKNHPAIRTAAMLAIEEHCELRTKQAETLIGVALKGNLSERHGALKVLCTIPEFHSNNLQGVRELLYDTNPLISELAANSMLINGMRAGTWSEPCEAHETAIREKVLSKLNQSDQEMPLSVSGITLDQGTIERMLATTDPVTKELAIRYIAMIKGDAAFVHRTISRTLRTANNGRLIAACMDSFRASPEALTLFNIADTDFVCGLVDHHERNVRLAALKLMGELPDDEQVIESLRTVLVELKGNRSREPEVSESAKATAKHVRRNPKLRTKMLELALSYIPRSVDDGFGDDDHQEHLRTMLYVCESIGGVDSAGAQRVLALAESFRTPERLRRQALRAFGRLAEPTVVNVNKLCSILDKNDLRLNEAAYPTVSSFVKRCRAKVEYVKRVYQALANLRTSLEAAWNREVSGSVDSIDPIGPRDIRGAILEIENLTAAYEEFSERAGPSGPNSN